MVGEGDRVSGSEDPFEDLDSFFAPIEGVQWPEEERRRSADPPATAAPPAPPVPTVGAAPQAGSDVIRLEPDEPEPSNPQPPDSGATREMTGEEWRRLRSVLGDEAALEMEFPTQSPPSLIELEDESGAYDVEPQYATVPPERVRVFASSSIASGSGSGRSDEGSPQPGGGGAGSASGEANESTPPDEGFRTTPSNGPPEDSRSEPSRSPAPEDLSTGDDLTSAWPEPEIDDVPGELTLDSLKKAPPEYRDLPGPREGGAVTPAPPSAFSRSAPAPEGPPSAQRPPASDPSGGPRVQVVGAANEPPPSLAEVEAMAESLAKEFRSSPTDEPAMEAERSTGRAQATRSGMLGGPAASSFEDDLLGQFEPPEPPEPPAPRSPPRTIKVGAPEDLTGPSWEDPTARTVTREPVSSPRREGERDLPMAVITAAALVAIALLTIAWKNVAFAVVVGAVIVLAQAEFYAAAQRQGYHPATLLGLVAGAMVVAGAYFRGEPGVLLMIVLALVATFLWFMATPVRARTDMIANAGVTIFGLVYIPVTGSFFVVILTSTGSKGLVLSALALTFLYDVSAFFIGRYWGRRPLAPTISPKKSWEGLLGATLVTVLVAAVLPPHFGPLTSEWKVFALGLVVVVFAPLGDLAESLLKRDLGIKDMGSILPGHGGMLDRIDSALLVGPAVFYFLRLIG